ncbi:MAG TPA: Rieske (2Fe-2S) protein [Gaiellaceae bacterium]|jgi:3-phenylpropionate/trans-cinnamate dioxygenase ferredoxin subunit
MTGRVVAAACDVPVGESRSYLVDGRRIAVFNVDGALYALRDRCPHQGAALSDGRIQAALVSPCPGRYRLDPGRPVVRCPWHGWEFDLETGRSVIDPRDARVRAYAVRVEDGSIVVDVPG